MSDTIYAAATAPGKAGVTVVRISGPEVPAILEMLGAGDCPARRACLRRLRDADGQTIDEALILRFDAGASFTGEAVAELQMHGSLAVQRAVYARLAETGLCRLAEPGEFTRRALLNDRMDLTEVQGLADLIEAETEEQRRAALRVLNGELSEQVEGWRASLVRAAALLEAVIDFADEEVPEDVYPEVRDLLESLQADLNRELAGRRSAVSLRDGFEVAILGRPNAGKSSLINAIAGSDVALVSALPGTTRDAIEVPIDIAGLKVRMTDTAGLRETTDQIEALGIQKARQRAERADLRIFLYEEEQPPVWDPAPQKTDITIRTKADLNGGDGLSARTGAGVDQLLRQIGEALSEKAAGAGLITRQRDVAAIGEADARLEVLLRELQVRPHEIVADELRSISAVLGRIIGAIGVEDVLDEVFRSFCLGK